MGFAFFVGLMFTNAGYALQDSNHCLATHKIAQSATLSPFRLHLLPLHIAQLFFPVFRMANNAGSSRIDTVLGTKGRCNREYDTWRLTESEGS